MVNLSTRAQYDNQRLITNRRGISVLTRRRAAIRTARIHTRIIFFRGTRTGIVLVIFVLHGKEDCFSTGGEVNTANLDIGCRLSTRSLIVYGIGLGRTAPFIGPAISFGIVVHKPSKSVIERSLVRHVGPRHGFPDLRFVLVRDALARRRKGFRARRNRRRTFLIRLLAGRRFLGTGAFLAGRRLFLGFGTRGFHAARLRFDRRTGLFHRLRRRSALDNLARRGTGTLGRRDFRRSRRLDYRGTAFLGRRTAGTLLVRRTALAGLFPDRATQRRIPQSGTFRIHQTRIHHGIQLGRIIITYFLDSDHIVRFREINISTAACPECGD